MGVVFDYQELVAEGNIIRSRRVHLALVPAGDHIVVEASLVDLQCFESQPDEYDDHCDDDAANDG